MRGLRARKRCYTVGMQGWGSASWSRELLFRVSRATHVGQGWGLGKMGEEGAAWLSCLQASVGAPSEASGLPSPGARFGRLDAVGSGVWRGCSGIERWVELRGVVRCGSPAGGAEGGRCTIPRGIAPPSLGRAHVDMEGPAGCAVLLEGPCGIRGVGGHQVGWRR